MNRRVLLVDDSVDFRDGVRQLLQRRYQVHEAGDGAQALEVCEERGPFAVVVSDYAMPVMDGIELFARLRQRCPDSVRVMLTGCADLALVQEALELGAIARFLTKPPLPAQLLEAVQEGVERFRVIEEERLATEQLFFTRETLLGLSGTLERRLEKERDCLEALERFAQELRDSASLEEIAERTAATVRALFGRTALVVLEDPGSGTEIRSGAPASPGGEHHLELLHAGERALGSIQVGPAETRTVLAPGERRTLSLLASSAALAAEGAIRRRQSEDARLATVRALAGLAENRDDDTGAHLDRVSEYCRQLALALREDGYHLDTISDGFLTDIVLAAPLHDIGKVAIPDSILFKPGKLDQDEWTVMRTHASIGAETLRTALERSGEQSFLRMAHEIAWCHHERWDGSGYPRGLSAESIPLAARIMALADCYDALTSVRPYKRAWTHREALAYVCEQRGKAFDPTLVDAFLARSGRFASIRERFGR